MVATVPLLILGRSRDRSTFLRDISAIADPFALNQSIHFLEFKGKEGSDAGLVRTRIKEKIVELQCATCEVWFLSEVKKPDKLPDQVGPTFQTRTMRSQSVVNLLSAKHLHWLDGVARSTSAWMHESVGRGRVEAWLAQFQAQGLDWVGEGLLRLLRVIDQPSLVAALLSAHADGDVFAIIDHVPGKSAAVVANLLQKRHEALFRLEVALRHEPFPERVIWVEDGLFSGTEIVGVLKSMCGKRSPDHSAKAEKIPDEVWSRIPWERVELRFYVGTDLGDILLRKACAELGLPELKRRRDLGIELKLLTDEGLSAWTRDEFFTQADAGSQYVADLKFISPYAFSPQNINAVWGTAERASEAAMHCRKIGSQLWKNYLHRQASWSEARWPDQRVVECGLGMRSLGLTLAFAHSVPKATLPVFWGGGEVLFDGGKRVNWLPLFPCA